jgi:hypothetical protein
MPKGGKHANNPILCEDQRVPDQRPSRLARTKNNPLDPDYTAGWFPQSPLGLTVTIMS